MAKPSDLRNLIAALPPPDEAPLSDPMAIIVWEVCAYLVPETRRRAAFEAFGEAVGYAPAAIAALTEARLIELMRAGGVYPELRARRLHAIATAIVEEHGGDLAGALKALTRPKARALLKRFPSIGDLSADRILLFSGTHPGAAVDSSGLRALARLGVAPGDQSYARTYRAAIEALDAAAGGDQAWLRHAWQALRALGQSLCKRNDPICVACPLDAVCAHQPIGEM